MPIQDFECTFCEHTEEHYLTQSEASENKFASSISCPVCDTKTMRRIVSLPATHQMGGVDGVVRSRENLKARNLEYSKSAKGREKQTQDILNCRKRGLPA